MELKKHIKKLVESIVYLTLGFIILFGQTSIALADGPTAKFNEAVQAVRDKNYVAAYEGFLPLAEAADHDAQYNLALLLRKGLGHPTNYAQSLKWTWLAELGGNQKAEKLRVELVELVPSDAQEIVRSQTKRILDDRFKSGDSQVILQLASFHLSVVVEPDYKSAYALRSLAAALGLEKAVELRDEIEVQLEPADLIEAQQMAASLFKEKNWVVELGE